MRSIRHSAGIRLLAAWAMAMVGTGTALAVDYYAVTNGNDSSNGLSWASAWKTLTNAAAQATNYGDSVTFSNGTFTMASDVRITNGVTFKSANGYNVTTLSKSAGTPRFLVYSNAVLDGFALAGYTIYPNSVVYLTGYATLRNCQVYSNSVDSGAIITTIGSNLIQNCLINNNSGRTGAIYLNDTTLPSTVESCTIYSNISWDITSPLNFVPGICFRQNRGVVRNSIVYGNTYTNGVTTNWVRTPTSFDYSCTTPLPSGTGNITNDPQVVSAADGDFHLAAGSPGINTGTNQSWMTGANDLDGRPRILHIVDMGAFEWYPAFKGTVFSFR